MGTIIELGDDMNIKKDINAILNEKDTYKCLLKGRSYIIKLIEIKNLQVDLYYDLTYYCMDFFQKGFTIYDDDIRFKINIFFGNKMEFFCNKYIQAKGSEVFNNKNDVIFLIEVANFYELADKFDEKFELLESIVLKSDNLNLKIMAIDEILNIGDLGHNVRNKYIKLKKEITLQARGWLG